MAGVRAVRPLPTPTALAIPPQRQVNVAVPAPPAPPVPQAMPPMANTYPPGVIPPQAPAPQPRSNRTGFWVLGALIVVVVLVVIGAAVTLFRMNAQGTGDNDPERSHQVAYGVTATDLDSLDRFDQTSRSRAHGTTSTTAHSAEVGGTAHDVLRGAS